MVFKISGLGLEKNRWPWSCTIIGCNLSWL